MTWASLGRHVGLVLISISRRLINMLHFYNVLLSKKVLLNAIKRELETTSLSVSIITCLLNQHPLLCPDTSLSLLTLLLLLPNIYQELNISSKTFTRNSTEIVTTLWFINYSWFEENPRRSHHTKTSFAPLSSFHLS